MHPWQLLLLVLAGWVNRRQQDVIEYLLVENRVLRQKLGKRRILLNEEQRRRLAVKGKILGRKMLEQVAGKNAKKIRAEGPFNKSTADNEERLRFLEHLRHYPMRAAIASPFSIKLTSAEVK